MVKSVISLVLCDLDAGFRTVQSLPNVRCRCGVAELLGGEFGCSGWHAQRGQLLKMAKQLGYFREDYVAEIHAQTENFLSSGFRPK